IVACDLKVLACKNDNPGIAKTQRRSSIEEPRLALHLQEQVIILCAQRQQLHWYNPSKRRTISSPAAAALGGRQVQRRVRPMGGRQTWPPAPAPPPPGLSAGPCRRAARRGN